ncbi:MAG: VTT domain-containing protein [Armatimonadota bacterium]|nr:VTT domain-containing protein [Armatimonadota bacterium]
MKRYWLLIGALLAFFLVLFVVAEALHISFLTDPSPYLKQGGVLAALVGVGLLVIDVVLPVPSSLVMIAHGALFGVVVGTLLSLIGSTGAALLGFAIGRRGGPLLARLVSPAEQAQADRLLRRWGALAIVVTRPVPLLAETVAILAGTSSLRWRQVAIAALAGSFPGALLYALTGAVAGSFSNGVLMFALVLLVAGGFFLAGRWWELHLQNTSDDEEAVEPVKISHSDFSN